jgi:hypothetical protein
MKKYKINECLDKLNHLEYSAAIKNIPEILGISVNTFHNYRNFDIRVTTDIPHRIVCKLELIFGLNQGELKNYEINLDPVQKRTRKKT